MNIQLKESTKRGFLLLLLTCGSFTIGYKAPNIHAWLLAPPAGHNQQPIEHSVHTAKLGVPALEDFDTYEDPMYEYYESKSGAHLEYPLEFTCGCTHKKQYGLADISYPDLEGKVYQVRHAPTSDDHKNLWFMHAEVKAPEAPATVVAPETNGN